MFGNPRTTPILPRIVPGGPDQVVRTPYELEQSENFRLGQKMDQNALSIFGVSPTRGESTGDILLREESGGGPVVPDMPQVERDSLTRGARSAAKSNPGLLFGPDLEEAKKGNYILNVSRRIKERK